MPAPAGFTQHTGGGWMKSSDQSGPYTFDGVSMILGALGTPASSLTTASSGNVANASAVATLAAVAAKTTYIAGMTITGGGATAGSLVNATLAGLAGGTATYTFAAPAGATVGATPLVLAFNPPLPASAVNTAIVLTLPALGIGNLNAAVSAWGYQQ